MFPKMNNTHNNVSTSIQLLSTSNWFYHPRDDTILKRAIAKQANRPELELRITASLAANNPPFAAITNSIRTSPVEDIQHQPSMAEEISSKIGDTHDTLSIQLPSIDNCFNLSVYNQACLQDKTNPKHKEAKWVKRPKPNLINGSNTPYTNYQAEKHGNNWNRWYLREYRKWDRCNMINENKPGRRLGK